MDVKTFDEQRLHERYSPESKIGTHFFYEIATKLKIQRFDKWTNTVFGEQHNAFLKNISVEGLCFCTEQKFQIGQFLYLEIFVPQDNHTVPLAGEIRWIKAIEHSAQRPRKFEVGVQLVTVNGHPVRDSIYFDQNYHVEWSEVLEAVFGHYRVIMQNQRNKRVD